MKKSIIALMGLFALVACSEDIYQEADKMNEEAGSQYQTNSFNPNDPGHYTPGSGFPINHAGINYASPWDIWFREKVVPHYNYTNLEGFHTSPFIIEITPFLGLAYYDDQNDGYYHDPAQGYSLIADFHTGWYPTLFQNNNEIGNLIKAETIILDGSSTQENEVSIGSTTDHCPINQGNLDTGWNPMQRYLNIDNAATQDEKDILVKYGKVYFYHIRVLDRANPLIVYVDNMMQNHCSFVGDWQDTSVVVSPFGTSHKLHYYKDLINGPGTVYTHNQTGATGAVCDSREIMFKNEFPEKILFSDSIGEQWAVTVSIIQGTSLWMTSGHHVGISHQ